MLLMMEGEEIIIKVAGFDFFKFFECDCRHFVESLSLFGLTLDYKYRVVCGENSCLHQYRGSFAVG